MLIILAKELIENEDFPASFTPITTGFPSPAADYIEGRIDLNKLLIKTPSATFFVKVEGESMVNAFIPNNSILVVDRSLNAISGNIVVAVINGELTVRRLLQTHARIFLKPENPKYQPIEINEEMSFQVWGVVITIIINPKDQ